MIARHVSFIAALVAVFILSSIQTSAQELADTAGFSRFRFGSKAEIVASFKNYGADRFQDGGASRMHRNTVSIPDLAFGFEYKFTPKWILGAEVEIGPGGDVAIDHLQVTRLVIPEFNVRAGHIIVPVGFAGISNDPVDYFGAVCPESQSLMIPCAWNATGVEVFGTFGKGYATFDYEAMVVAGLNASGFDRDNWVAPGEQGLFESDNFNSPGYLARLDWRGVPGLRTGVSFYYCHDAGANSDNRDAYAGLGRIPVEVFAWDAEYSDDYLTARADLAYGHVGNTRAVNASNGNLAEDSPFSGLTPVAKNALSYGVEVGFNVGNTFRISRCPVLYPFARYEYTNPQKVVEQPYVADRRLETAKWTVGVNWFPLPELVVKADYAMRRVGTSQVFGKGAFNNENEFSIGIAYVGWLFSR